MFSYSPLSREKRETRFFQFTPDCESDPNRISLQLRHGSLDDDTLQYRALSYVWGDAKDKVEIEVNGEQFLVGKNLHAFLQRLHCIREKGWLWADAICIQQSNDEEKSWHVQRMGDIFKKAELVYSWLGLGSVATEVAMDFFNNWGPRAVKAGAMESRWRQQLDNLEFWYSIWKSQTTGHMDAYGFFDEFVSTLEDQRADEESRTTDLESFPYLDPIHIKGIRGTDMGALCHDLVHAEGIQATDEKSALTDVEIGITQLLTHDHWHRIWIFQEMALARHVVIICGTRTTSIVHLEAILGLLWKFREEPHIGAFFGQCPVRTGFFERLPSGLYPNKAIRIRQALCREEFMTLGSILVAFSRPSGRPWYRATDPCDIVYGILGLLTNDDRCSLGSVDYQNRTWIELFAQATRRLIEESLTRTDEPDESTYHIGFCLPRPRDQLGELPSWVPDWRDVGVNGLPASLLWRRTYSHGARGRASWSPDEYPDASKTKRSRKELTLGFVSPVVLPLPGYRVDIVSHVMAYDYAAENVLEQDRPSDWLACIRQYMGLSGQSNHTSPLNSELEDHVWLLALGCNGAGVLLDWLDLEQDNKQDPRFLRMFLHHPQDYYDHHTLPNTLVKILTELRATPWRLERFLPKARNMKNCTNNSVESHQPKSTTDHSEDDATETVDEMAQVEEGERVDSKGALKTITESDKRLLITALISALFCHSRLKKTTFFKTANGLLGNGIGDVRPGDTLVIFQNVDTPFLLRPRRDDEDARMVNTADSERYHESWTFGGEAWVDGIMEGEVMETNPSGEVFDIY